MSWERMNSKDKLIEILRPGSPFVDKYASSFYRSFLAAKHEVRICYVLSILC
jgi:hypothetical protein